MNSLLLLAGAEADSIVSALGQGSYSISVKAKLPAALRAIEGREVVVVGREFGPDAASDILAYNPECLVILLHDGDAPEECGAYECIEAGRTARRLPAAVKNAVRLQRMRDDLRDLMGEHKLPHFLKSRHKGMQRSMRMIEEAALINEPVLLMGERGTGRGSAARAIHAGGPRRTSAFVTLEPVRDGVEAELFGRLSGGDLSEGLLHKADGGTLYLGDVGPISGELTRGIMGLLGNRMFRPVGSPAEARSDARIICGVNGGPVDEALLAMFPVRVTLPPLRERGDDIMPLAEVFLAEAIDEFGTGLKKFTRGARKLMMEYPWPGNVKELKYAVRKAVLLSPGPRIEERHLGTPGALSHVTMKEFLAEKLTSYIRDMARCGRSDIHQTVIAEAERALVELALAETGGNQVRASRALGISRATLRTKIKSYGITPPAAAE